MRSINRRETIPGVVSRFLLLTATLALIYILGAYDAPANSDNVSNRIDAVLTSISDMIVVSDAEKGTIVYAADGQTGAVFSYRLSSQSSSLISFEEFSRVRSSVEFKKPSTLAYKDGKLLVGDSEVGAVYELDVSTGNATVLVNDSTAGGPKGATSVAVSPAGETAIGFDDGDSVYLLAQGNSPVRLEVQTTEIDSPERISFTNSGLLVLDRKNQTLYQVPLDKSTGDVSKLFDKVPDLKDFAFFGGIIYLVIKNEVSMISSTSFSGSANQERRAISMGTNNVDLSRIAVNEESIFVANSKDKQVIIRPRPAPIRQLQEHADYFIWLNDITNSIYRSKRPSGNARNSDASSVQLELPLGAAEKLWSGQPLIMPTSIAVSESGKIYIADRERNTILELEPGGTPQQVFAGRPFQEITSLTSVKDRLYILDGAARKLYCLNTTRKEIVEENVTPLDPFPERLRHWNGHVLGLNRYSKVLHHLVATDYPNLTQPLDESLKEETLEGPGGPWVMLKPGKVNTLKYLDTATIGHSLSSITDFTVADNNTYLLDAQRRRIVLLPLGGGETTYINYEEISKDPSVIIAGESGLYLGDGFKNTFARIPPLISVLLNFEGIWTSDEIVQLYRYLHSKYLLPLKRYTVTERTSLEKLSFEQNIMPLRYVDTFQCLFCDLNPDMCSTGQLRCPDLTSGQRNSSDHVSIEAQKRIWLPDLKVIPYKARRPIRLPLDPVIYHPKFFAPFLNATLGEIAAAFNEKRAQTDELSQALLDLNPDYKGANIMSEKDGSFIIHVLSARMHITVPKSDMLNTTSPLRRILAKANVTGAYRSPTLLPRSSRTGTGIAAFQSSLNSDFSAALNPRCKPLTVEELTQAMKYVHYCLPLDMNVERVPVGVIDNVFDINHQAFTDPVDTKAFNIYQNEFNLQRRQRPEGEEVPRFNEGLDHGTHVTGLIAARRYGNGIVGFYPFARIYAMSETDVDLATSDWPYINIFNISLGEIGVSEAEAAGGSVGNEARFRDALALSLLKGFVDRSLKSLFVIAAGNEHGKVKADSLAAKGNERSNVIVVGAAEDERHRLDESNFGKAVSVFAPGKDVRSTLYGNSYGVASGTSQATALVTGTAAMLKSIERNWAPWQIKFRIISTADLWSYDTTQSGLLNIERAVLDTNKLVIKFQLKDSYGDDGECRGQIAPEFRDRELVISKRGNEPTVTIPLKNILRVWRNTNGSSTHSTFTVLWYTADEVDDFGVKREIKRKDSVEGVRFEGSTSFRFEGSPTSDRCANIEVNLLDLTDFVNTFSEENN